MNKLIDLINILCPKGVEHIKISDITDYEQPTKYIVKSTRYDDSFETPVLTAGQTFILGYTNEKSGIFNASKDKPVIIFDDFTGSFKWVDFPFKVKSSAMKIITAKENIIFLRYLFYNMCRINYSSNEHKRLWISTYSEFKIPVPPLSIQREIIGALDLLSTLNIELCKDLQKEIELRKKQFSICRDSLFADNEAEMVALNDSIVSLKTGLNPRKNFKLNCDGATCPYITGKDIFDNRINITERTDRITEDAVALINKRSQLQDDILLFASTGTGTVGRMAVVEKYDGKWNLSETMYCIKAKTCLLPKYLMYYLYSSHARNQFDDKISKGSVPHLKVSDLLKVKIPILSLEKQKSIVDTIDSLSVYFENLIDDLSEEKRKRKNQYSFYLSQLLNFKELKA